MASDALDITALLSDDPPGWRRLLGQARHIGDQAARWAVAGAAGAAGIHTLVDPLPLWAAGLGLAGTVTADRLANRRARHAGQLRPDVDPLDAIRAEALRAGGGAFIGVDRGIVHAPAECATLVLAPPRAGKTTSVIVPSVLSAPGAVLTTSTKPDVLMTTARARSRFGTVYLFDPTGHASGGLPPGVVPLRWSPLDAAGTWESARRLGQAMVAASPAAKGTRHESHWTSRAAALLGPLLYAAKLQERGIREVVAWVLSGSTKDADGILMDHGVAGNVDALLAAEVLQGVQRAATEERQSIWSATADVIDVYTTWEALDAASRSNFDPAAFVRSEDTIYIAAAAEAQAAVAPLVVALVEAVRDAQYRRHRGAVIAGEDPGQPVSLVLDEVANVAPIASLPALVSEAGGQGLHVVAALQDLSQVRGRWGAEIAEGFLSLFQHVLVLGGIRDTRTLEALSVIVGEWDRPHLSRSRSTTWSKERGTTWSRSKTYTTVRQRRMTPGEIYALDPGQALYLSGAGWRLVRLAPHYAHRRWQRALAAAPGEVVLWAPPDLRPAEPVMSREAVRRLRRHSSGESGGGRGIQRELGEEGGRSL